MNRLLIFLFLTIILSSCKNDNLDKVIQTSKNPEIDMVFHSIILENKVIGTSIAIIDKSSKRNSTGIVEFDTIKRKQNDLIYWNKNIFPKIEYLSQELLNKKQDIETQNDERLFWKFAEKYNQGWIKISKPIFTNNKKRAIVFVEFENPNRKFGSTTYYVLEKINGTYKIVKQKIIGIS